MKILIDMNLSPGWVQEFKSNQIEAVHWSQIGKHDAPDTAIMAWAKANNYVIFTHDLDFGTALALSNSGKPSHTGKNAKCHHWTFKQNGDRYRKRLLRIVG